MVMLFNSLRGIVTLGAAVVLSSAAVGQQPAKAPPLPPIAPNQARLAQTINDLDGPGFASAYSEETGILAAACEHGTIQYWHKDVLLGVRVGDGTPNILKGHAGPVTALVWDGGPVLASAGADHKVLLWDVGDHRILHTLPGGGIVRALAMTPDGKLLASAGDDPTIQLWDPATGKPGHKLQAHTDWVLALSFSPDGKQLASGGHDGTVRLWDPASGKKLLEFPSRPAAPANTPPGPANTVMALAFSPDGKLLALGGSDMQIHLVNTADGKIVRSLPGHTSSVTALAFHASGTVLASASKDGTVRLWNPANGQALKTLEGHTAWVQGVVFLAQGTRLASVGADRTVRLWELTVPK
jgi:WD40 repeat protein